MELRSLRYFVAVAEERSFTRAAERLWVAQPGLSTQIRRLETELGVQLFVRHTRGAEPTAAGKVLLERARNVLTAVDSVLATGHDVADGTVGSLRLGVASWTRWGRTDEMLTMFSEAHRGVDLSILEGLGGCLWRELRDRRLDAVIAPSCCGGADLRRLDLGGEPWVALVSSRHPLATMRQLDPESLYGKPILVNGQRDAASQDDALTALLADLGLSPRLMSGTPGSKLGAVVAGRAVALTTAPGLLSPELVVRPLSPTRTLSFSLLWRDEPQPPVLRKFVDSVRNALEQAREPRARLAAA